MKVAVIIAIALVVLAAGLMLQQAKSAVFRWDYDYVHDPPCTDTRTKSCVTGFNLVAGDPNSQPKPTFVPNRFDQHEQLVSKGIEARVNFKTSGNVQFCVTSVGADATGAAVESRPACVSKFVGLFVTEVKISARE
jgi:hypothetical protein